MGEKKQNARTVIRTGNSMTTPDGESNLPNWIGEVVQVQDERNARVGNAGYVRDEGS